MAQDTLLGFPAHTLYPQGVCSIRKAAEPLTAALPFRRGEFTTLLTISAARKGRRRLIQFSSASVRSTCRSSSSADTPNSFASASRLEVLGSAVPVSHLLTA